MRKKWYYPTVRFEESREWHRTDTAEVDVAFGPVPPDEGEWTHVRMIAATARSPHSGQEFGLALSLPESEFRFDNLDRLQEMRSQMEQAITVAILKDANPDNPAAPDTPEEVD